MTSVDTNVSTHKDNRLSCLCSHNTNKCACDHSKKLWILDLGASMYFTPDQSDFIEYQELTGSAHIPVQTVSTTIFVKGQGQVLVCWEDSLKNSHILELHDVGHISNSNVCLVGSMPVEPIVRAHVRCEE